MSRAGPLPASLVLAALATLAPTDAAADGLPLQGMFCSGEAALDAALAGIASGLAPRAAAAAVNQDAVRCTCVDLLHYVVEAPEPLESHAGVPRYRADLVGVVVGGRLRPVSPPVTVFFVTPRGLPDAILQRRP